MIFFFNEFRQQKSLNSILIAFTKRFLFEMLMNQFFLTSDYDNNLHRFSLCFKVVKCCFNLKNIYNG